MSVCKICGSLDFVETYQEESRQLSWLVEDIAVLYEENSSIVKKIKELNMDLENLDKTTFEFHEETIEDDASVDGTAVYAEEVWRTELKSLEMDIWLQKEEYLRERLMQQLFTLSHDLSSLQHQPQHHPPHPPKQPHLPRHLWGHQTLQWHPPSPALLTRTRKTRQQQRLSRWLQKRMPINLRDLQF